MEQKFVDYYKALDLKQHATTRDIKVAFKDKSLKWHPDKNIGVDTTDKMQQINEAYRILSNNSLRAKYDIKYNKLKAPKVSKVESIIKDIKEEKAIAKKVPNYVCDLKTNKELFAICKNAVKYPLEYIHAVLVELRKRFSTQSIKDILKRINIFF